MRVWDFPVYLLCKVHLSGEHREIHGLITVIKRGKVSPYWPHPETQRWIGNIGLLIKRHNIVAEEMKNRGMNHRSPIICNDFNFNENLNQVESLYSQLENIAVKSEDINHKCSCNINELENWIKSVDNTWNYQNILSL